MFRNFGVLGGYEKQTGKTEVLRPFLLALLYAAVILLVYAPAIYLEAVLAGVVFGPALLACAFASLLRVSWSASGLSVGRREIDGGRRLLALLALAVGALFVYLRVDGAWGWTWAVGGGRLWIGTPWRGFSLPSQWAAARYGLAIALPVALVPAGIELLARILMEIGYPNLANSVRAAAGVLLRRRWIGYRRADGEPESATMDAPPENWA